MNKKEPKYHKLIQHLRNNLEEEAHSGLIIHLNKKGIINKIGEDNDYRFFHRSCMKPLQMGLDKKYNLTDEEIAVCAASHCGDLIHQKAVLSVLNKADFNEKDLLCPPIEPLSDKEKKRLIINKLPISKIHNNCSGKHAAMLLICKEMGFDIKNYTDINHPLSRLIIKKVCDLCETDTNNIIISKDGCTLPVIATSLYNLGLGFLNLFCDKKYEKITNAFLKHPYIAGGNNRLDSEIINASERLVCKVGAGGLCVVVNLNKEEALVVKIADCNMQARTNVVINALIQLKWPISINETGQINNIYTKNIITETGEIIGKIKPCFDLH